MAALLVVCLSGCIPGLVSFSAREFHHRFTIVAPDRVRRGEILTFRVELTKANGEDAPDITYGWVLDWADVKGAMKVGKAFEPQQKETQGSPGTAVLRIYAKNDSKRVVQVARKDIQVE